MKNGVIAIRYWIGGGGGGGLKQPGSGLSGSDVIGQIFIPNYQIFEPHSYTADYFKIFNII